jgi:hypothetical protein
MRMEDSCILRELKHGSKNAGGKRNWGLLSEPEYRTTGSIRD